MLSSLPPNQIIILLISSMGSVMPFAELQQSPQPEKLLRDSIYSCFPIHGNSRDSLNITDHVRPPLLDMATNGIGPIHVANHRKNSSGGRKISIRDSGIDGPPSTKDNNPMTFLLFATLSAPAYHIEHSLVQTPRESISHKAGIPRSARPANNLANWAPPG